MAEKERYKRKKSTRRRQGKAIKDKATNLLDWEPEVESLLPSGEKCAYSPEYQTAEKRKGREGEPKMSKSTL